MNYTFINYPTLLLKTSRLLHHLEENSSPQHSMQGQVYKTRLGRRSLSATPPRNSNSATGHARLRVGLSQPTRPFLEGPAAVTRPSEPSAAPRAHRTSLLSQGGAAAPSCTFSQSRPCHAATGLLASHPPSLDCALSVPRSFCSSHHHQSLARCPAINKHLLNTL